MGLSHLMVHGRGDMEKPLCHNVCNQNIHFHINSIKPKSRNVSSSEIIVQFSNV